MERRSPFTARERDPMNLARASNATHVLLRIVAGFLFVHHGGQKLFGWFGGSGPDPGGPWRSCWWGWPAFWSSTADRDRLGLPSVAFRLPERWRSPPTSPGAWRSVRRVGGALRVHLPVPGGFWRRWFQSRRAAPSWSRAIQREDAACASRRGTGSRTESLTSLVAGAGTHARSVKASRTP